MLEIAEQHAPVASPVLRRAKPLEHPLDKPVSVRLGDAEGPRRGPVQKGPDRRDRVQPCFFHVDHHASHHDRVRTAAAQTYFSVEIRPGFRLILYWKRLCLAFSRPCSHNRSP